MSMEKLKDPQGLLTKNEIILIRHFDDVDDLSIEGRDAVLLPGQEHKAFTVAKSLVEECQRLDVSVLFFTLSTKIRTQQTVSLIADEVKKLNPSLKIRTSLEKDLRAIDEGVPVLPENYKAGDLFDGFSIANRIFSREVHKSDHGDFTDNIDYRHADPIVDNEEKYPELQEKFSAPGESYREVMQRLLSLVVKFKELQERSSEKTKFVIVTHAQPSQIIKDLVEVFSKIKNKSIVYEDGALLKLCWESYNKRDPSERVTGRIDFVTTDLLFDDELFTLLKNEIDILYATNH